jgi:hypothetical protein
MKYALSILSFQIDDASAEKINIKSHDVNIKQKEKKTHQASDSRVAGV